jgi:hypothetical protein
MLLDHFIEIRGDLIEFLSLSFGCVMKIFFEAAK